MITSEYIYRMVKDIASVVVSYINAAAEEARNKETGV